MFAIQDKNGDFFQGYDMGILFWGNTEYKTYNDKSVALGCAAYLNKLPMVDGPQAKVVKILPTKSKIPLA